ncbi:hypothetical protein SNE40_002414 [Patella caerulea]|uniref:Uncharacterized protein n=1 Tax=Patella caerulea TaxID=87958 RepID=A0AAN8PZU6_PATCE
MSDNFLFNEIYHRTLRLAQCLNRPDESLTEHRHECERIAGIISEISVTTEEVSDCLNQLRKALQLLDDVINLQTRQQGHNREYHVSSGIVGPPKLLIPQEQLQYLVDNNFKLAEIANLFNVSKRTVCRRLKEYNKYIHFTKVQHFK